MKKLTTLLSLVALSVAVTVTTPAFAQDGDAATTTTTEHHEDGDDDSGKWGLAGLLGLLGLLGRRKRDEVVTTHRPSHENR